MRQVDRQTEIERKRERERERERERRGGGGSVKKLGRRRIIDNGLATVLTRPGLSFQETKEIGER